MTGDDGGRRCCNLHQVAVAAVEGVDVGEITAGQHHRHPEVVGGIGVDSHALDRRTPPRFHGAPATQDTQDTLCRFPQDFSNARR